MAKKTEPEKQTASPVTVYMPNVMLKEIDEAGRHERRSRSAQMIVLLEEALAAREARESDAELPAVAK
jgi:hypothetical protein